MTENWGISEFFGTILLIFPFFVYLAFVLFDFFGELRDLFRISKRSFR